MRALLDTNFVIELQRHKPKPFVALRNFDSAAVSVISLGEMEAGESTDHLEQLTAATTGRMSVLDVTAATARVYGTIYRALRRVGTPIPQNDMWIAATAIEHGLTLLTFDKHFARIAELKSVIL